MPTSPSTCLPTSFRTDKFGLPNGSETRTATFAHSACRNGYSVAYRCLPRLLTELAIARADGRYPKLLASIAKTELLIIDNWGLAKLNAENRHNLLEFIEDRYAIRSTVVTSQLPVEKWHDVVADSTQPSLPT